MIISFPWMHLWSLFLAITRGPGAPRLFGLVPPGAPRAAPSMSQGPPPSPPLAAHAPSSTRSHLVATLLQLDDTDPSRWKLLAQLAEEDDAAAAEAPPPSASPGAIVARAPPRKSATSPPRSRTPRRSRHATASSSEEERKPVPVDATCYCQACQAIVDSGCAWDGDTEVCVGCGDPLLKGQEG